MFSHLICSLQFLLSHGWICSQANTHSWHLACILQLPVNFQSKLDGNILKTTIPQGLSHLEPGPPYRTSIKKPSFGDAKVTMPRWSLSTLYDNCVPTFGTHTPAPNLRSFQQLSCWKIQWSPKGITINYICEGKCKKNPHVVFGVRPELTC